MARFHGPVGPTEPGRFTVCPVHQTRETAQNYLGRVTAFFGYRTPKEFCRDYDLNLRAIHHGEPDALRYFARMTGADPNELIRWTPRRIRRGLMVLNGEILETRINPRHVVRICPRCAMDAIAANPGTPLDQVIIGRAEWIAAVVDGCLEHGVALISHKGPQLDLLRLDPGYQTSLLIDELPPTRPVPTTFDDFQLYFLSRIGIIPPKTSPLLDDVPLDGVTQICRTAGLDMMRHRGTTNELTDKELRAAGFELLGHGAERFECALIEMRLGMRLSQRAKSILPLLLDALQNRMRDEPWANLIDRVVEIIFRNLPYAAGDALLGRTCQVRSIHDFTSAKQAYNISRHHLRAFLAGTPELAVQPFRKPHDALIRIDVADRLILGKAPFISAMDVARKLGRHPRLATVDLAAFSDAGFKLHEAGSITRSELPVYSEAAVDAAIAALLGRCKVLIQDGPGLYSPSRIAVILGMPLFQVWKLIAEGSAGQLYVLKGAAPLTGLRLYLSAVVEAISGLKSTMTYIQAAGILESSTTQIVVLVADGHLSTAKLRDGFTTRHGLLDPKSVGQFQIRYMSAREALRRLAPNGNIRTLRGRGLEPAIYLPKGVRGVNYATYFLRQDVLNKLI